MRKWLIGGIAVGLWAFEPWRLFTSSNLDEPVPGGAVAADESILDVAATPEPTPTGPADRPADPPVATDAPEEKPRLTLLGQGEFETAEHDTSGLAVIVENADGSRFLRVEGLATSDGPDLDVGLSDAPSGGEWGSYDDGRYVRLDDLKATHGNHNYEIPDDVDLEGLTTVVIWCDRFNVAFGTADVSRPA